VVRTNLPSCQEAMLLTVFYDAFVERLVRMSPSARSPSALMT
jgi:hypothetical protein